MPSYHHIRLSGLRGESLLVGGLGGGCQNTGRWCLPPPVSKLPRTGGAAAVSLLEMPGDCVGKFLSPLGSPKRKPSEDSGPLPNFPALLLPCFFCRFKNSPCWQVSVLPPRRCRSPHCHMVCRSCHCLHLSPRSLHCFRPIAVRCRCWCWCQSYSTACLSCSPISRAWKGGDVRRGAERRRPQQHAQSPPLASGVIPHV